MLVALGWRWLGLLRALARTGAVPARAVRDADAAKNARR
jgi:hypothetical protein